MLILYAKTNTAVIQPNDEPTSKEYLSTSHFIHVLKSNQRQIKRTFMAICITRHQRNATSDQQLQNAPHTYLMVSKWLLYRYECQ